MIKIQEVKQEIPREHRTKYWYFTRHGICVPKGAEILDIIEDGWDTWILLNNKLTPEQIDEYDMKEKAPPYELLKNSREMQRHREKEQSGFGRDYLTFDYESYRKENKSRFYEGHTEDGYMGATKWVGDKSHLSLYGKDLSSAIRQDLKDNGITGCTVRTSHGDSVTVTVKGKDSDKIPYNQWRKNNFESDVMGWFNEYGYAPIGNGNYVTYNDYLEYTDDEIEDFARQYYDVTIGNKKEFQINQYYIERNYSDTFTRQFIDKLKKINDILVEFVYDDSNAQVDYFARNIYYHIIVVFQ